MSTYLGRAITVKIDTIKLTHVNAGPTQTDSLAMRYSVKKDLKSNPNTCDLTIRNMNPSHRRGLQQLKKATVQIDAGYVDRVSTIFLGDMRTNFAQREGADWVVALSAGDGEKAIQTARVNTPFRAGTDVGTVLTALATALGVSKGNLATAVAALRSGGFAGLFSGGTVLSGSARAEMDLVCMSVGYGWSVQNGALQLLPLGGSLKDTAINISQAHGMIGSPTVDKDGVISVRILQTPDVFPGRKFVVTAHELKGQYIAQECAYSGDTHGQDWYIDVKGKPF